MGNKDHYFEGSSIQPTIDKHIVQVDDSIESSNGQINDSEVTRKQLARIEVKLNKLDKSVVEIHRMLIVQHTKNVKISMPKLAELPISTTESFEKFETDLKDTSYAEKVVSELLLSELVFRFYSLLFFTNLFKLLFSSNIWSLLMACVNLRMEAKLSNPLLANCLHLSY